ncbi:MAG: SDR family oxidoreductase [Longimicrobiaceae bacterium]
MTRYQEVQRELRKTPRAWLVTGAAGFIGSNLVEKLLELGQEVVGIDNFATGSRQNLEDVRAGVGDELWKSFHFIEGNICNLDTCHQACKGIDYVLHQAALGSVPRSINDPISTNRTNVDGFLNMLVAARDMKIRRFVYAASSSTYGDEQSLPKVEGRIGQPLSPYAVSKYANELYAHVFQRHYGLEAIGLRYFNVFGRRQDPEGAYAAVIPRWVGRMLAGDSCTIYGDGETSRDFTHIDNVLQANLLAVVTSSGSTDQIYNVACGERITLESLFSLIRDGLARREPEIANQQPAYGDFRAGDVRHSLASIEKISDRLGYRVERSVKEGLELSLDWYIEHACRDSRPGRSDLR